MFSHGHLGFRKTERGQGGQVGPAGDQHRWVYRTPLDDAARVGFRDGLLPFAYVLCSLVGFTRNLSLLMFYPGVSTKWKSCSTLSWIPTRPNTPLGKTNIDHFGFGVLGVVVCLVLGKVDDAVLLGLRGRSWSFARSQTEVVKRVVRRRFPGLAQGRSRSKQSVC